MKPAVTDIALNPFITNPFLALKAMIFVVWCCCLSSISRRSIPCFHWYSNLKLFNKFIITIRLRQRLDTLIFGEGARRMTPHNSKSYRKYIELLMENDLIEPSYNFGLLECWWQKKKTQLNFFATEISNNKKCLPFSTPRFDARLS